MIFGALAAVATATAVTATAVTAIWVCAIMLDATLSPKHRQQKTCPTAEGAVSFAMSNCFHAANAMFDYAAMHLDDTLTPLVQSVQGCAVWPYLGLLLHIRALKPPSCVLVKMSRENHGHAFVLLHNSQDNTYTMLHAWQGKFGPRAEDNAIIHADDVLAWLRSLVCFSALARSALVLPIGGVYAKAASVWKIAERPCGADQHTSLGYNLVCNEIKPRRLRDGVSVLSGLDTSQPLHFPSLGDAGQPHFLVKFKFVPHNATVPSTFSDQ